MAGYTAILIRHGDVIERLTDEPVGRAEAQALLRPTIEREYPKAQYVTNKHNDDAIVVFQKKPRKAVATVAVELWEDWKDRRIVQ